jgi:hypothetical protein
MVAQKPSYFNFSRGVVVSTMIITEAKVSIAIFYKIMEYQCKFERQKMGIPNDPSNPML